MNLENSMNIEITCKLNLALLEELDLDDLGEEEIENIGRSFQHGR